LELDYKEETFNRIFAGTTNALNIEKLVGLKKDSVKIGRGSQSLLKDTTKYNSQYMTVKTIHHLQEGKKERLTPSRTLKLV
jgi:hypothetical protein